MDFFRSVKQASVASLRQGLQIVHSVSAAATDLASAPSSFLFRKVSPEEELQERFQALCAIIDSHAASPNASSLEGERAFFDSKARDHVKELLRLIQVEDMRWVASHNNAAAAQGSDDLVYPCMSVFMGKHMMGELCSRANRDRPRGCMSLVLAMAASLLRYTRYPLLPNQSVHVPVSQLITNAMRTSLGPSAEAAVDYHSADFQAYKQKLDYNLVTLVAVLWKKIMENPTLLDCFLFVDRRSQQEPGALSRPEDGSQKSRIRPQLDAISCLIPLMGKPKIGSYAKQAILNAIAIRDARIETFVVLETNMLDNVITELCKKYQKVVEVWSSLESGEQVSKSGSKIDLLSSSNGAGSADNAKLLRQSLDVFLRVLRFCHSINSVASEMSAQATVDWGIYPRLSSLGGDRERSPSASPPRNASFGHHYSSRGAESACSISAELTTLFRDLFLDVCLRSATSSSSSEQYVLSVQSLLRRIVEALKGCESQHNVSISTKTRMYSGSTDQTSHSLVRKRTALHELAANFFLGRPDFVGVLVARAGAVSKAVVISSLSLLSDLLATASLKDLIVCVFADGSAHAARDKTEAPKTPVKRAASSNESDIQAFLESFLQRPLVLCNPSADAHHSEIRKCLDLEYKGVPRNYVEAALVRLMARVDKLVNLRKLFERFAPHRAAGYDELEWIESILSQDTSLDRDEVKPGKPSQTILDLVYRKLGNFASLKFDEQIAVTNILCQLFCAISTLCVVSNPKISTSAKHFVVLGKVFEVLEQQLSAISSHLTSMFPPGYDVLLEFAKVQMQRSPTKAKKPKELDDVRVQRAVESAVLLEGLLFELKAFIISAVALRRQLSQDLSFSERLNEMSKHQSPVVASLRSGMKSSLSLGGRTPVTSAMDFSMDEWDLAGMEDFEFEEDVAASNAVKQLASTNLGQIDLLVKEIEDDIFHIDEEFQALQSSFSSEDALGDRKPRSESMQSNFDDLEKRLGSLSFSRDEADVAVY